MRLADQDRKDETEELPGNLEVVDRKHKRKNPSTDQADMEVIEYQPISSRVIAE